MFELNARIRGGKAPALISKCLSSSNPEKVKFDIILSLSDSARFTNGTPYSISWYPRQHHRRWMFRIMINPLFRHHHLCMDYQHRDRLRVTTSYPSKGEKTNVSHHFLGLRCTDSRRVTMLVSHTETLAVSMLTAISYSPTLPFETLTLPSACKHQLPVTEEYFYAPQKSLPDHKPERGPQRRPNHQSYSCLRRCRLENRYRPQSVSRAGHAARGQSRQAEL